jgi:hypothetical protein
MTKQNLIAKINRRLRPLGQKLITKRKSIEGPHYIIDVEKNDLMQYNIGTDQLEALFFEIQLRQTEGEPLAQR